jgi:hypothetical protein
MTDLFSLSAFGLEVTADFRLPATTAFSGAAESAGRLALRRVGGEELPAPDEGLWSLRNLQAYDGKPYAMLEGPDGAVLFQYGRDVAFHLRPDRSELRCAFSTLDDPGWQRVLLDTVLCGISLMRGFELLHCSAIASAVGPVCFTAGVGGGKSSLAAEYLRRDARLFSDDVVALERGQDRIVAHPGPSLMNLPRTIDPALVRAQAVLAEFGDERWVELPRPALSPGSVAAIIILDRSAGAKRACRPTAATSLDLLARSITLPHIGQARRRFELFAALAEKTPVLHLTADPEASPAELADLVDGALR